MINSIVILTKGYCSKLTIFVKVKALTSLYLF